MSAEREQLLREERDRAWAALTTISEIVVRAIDKPVRSVVEACADLVADRDRWRTAAKVAGERVRELGASGG